MTSSAAGAPRDGDDDDLGDLPEGLLPEGVLDDAAEDDAPARSKPTPSPRKPPPSSSPSRLDARGEDDKSALDATVPKVSPVPDLSFTSFTSALTRYVDRETRAEVASRAATRLPAAVRPVTGFDHARVAPAGWFSHPRAENGSLTMVRSLPAPGRDRRRTCGRAAHREGRRARAQPRRASPLPATRYDVVRVPVARAPSFFFPSLLFICHGHPTRAISIDGWKVPRWRGAATRVATDADARNPR